MFDTVNVLVSPPANGYPLVMVVQEPGVEFVEFIPYCMEVRLLVSTFNFSVIVPLMPVICCPFVVFVELDDWMFPVQFTAFGVTSTGVTTAILPNPRTDEMP